MIGILVFTSQNIATAYAADALDHPWPGYSAAFRLRQSATHGKDNPRIVLADSNAVHIPDADTGVW